ncbi:MAG TPA: phasin family protein [Noviherbaspirillum sp.]
MFPFLKMPGQDLARKSLEAQFSMMTTLSARMLSASQQLVALNRTAGQRLIEESAADLRTAMQLRSLPDAQAFMQAQSRASIEKVRGYWQNVQQIAADNLLVSSEDLRSLAATEAGIAASEQRQSSTQAQKGQEKGQEKAQDRAQAEGEESHAAHAHHGQHEVDVHPSPLVEKLIANAAASGTPGTP